MELGNPLIPVKLTTAERDALTAVEGMVISNITTNQLEYYDGSSWGAAGGLVDIVEDTTPQLGGTLDTNQKQIQWSQGLDIVSANVLTIGTDGNYFDVTGTTTITQIASLGSPGTVIKLHFDASLTLTHASPWLLLPGEADIVTGAGDEMEIVEYFPANWRCTKYTRANGHVLTNSLQILGGTGDQGTMTWDTAEQTVSLINNGVDTKIGQEFHYHSRNTSGGLLTKGTVVKASGTLGASNKITFDEMVADGSVDAHLILGILEEDIANNAEGKVQDHGKVTDFDTSMWSEGEVLYADPAVNGGLTNVKPAAPNLKLPIAFVLYSHASNGIIQVRVETGTDLNSDHGAELTAVSDGDIMTYVAANSRWENSQTGNHVAATTLSTWVLDAGNIYYQDFVHNLNTDDIGIEIYDSVTKETVLVEKLDRTDANTLRVYVSGNTESFRVVVWDAIFGFQGTSGRNVISNPTTPYAAQNNDIIIWDCTSGNKVVDLPPVATSNHFRIDVKKTDATANTITNDPNGAELIEDDSTAVVTTQYESITMVCDGAKWWVIASA